MFSLVEMFLMLLLPVVCLIVCSIVISMIEQPLQANEHEALQRI